MAINREPRENLMRDATAYSRRLSIQNSTEPEPVFAGIRQQGGWSVYFGEDPVFQFNAQSQLRRAHFKNQNYAAAAGKLLLLHRDRSGGHVEIQRIYSAETERCIVDDCRNRLYALVELLSSSADKCACFPVDDRALVSDLVGLIQLVCLKIQIADTANA
jgi:hypothetical protein